MERLTDKKSRNPIFDAQGGLCVTSEFVERLAEYEDTGLSPEEITSLKETWDMYGGEDGIMALYRQAENDPLTLDELREMDGMPVWITIPGENCGEWAIMRKIELGDICILCPVGVKRRYGDDASGVMGDYGKNWIAYRRKPEEGAK